MDTSSTDRELLSTREVASLVSEALDMPVSMESVSQAICRRQVSDEIVVRIGGRNLIKRDGVPEVVEAIRSHDRRTKPRSATRKQSKSKTNRYISKLE